MLASSCGLLISLGEDYEQIVTIDTHGNTAAYVASLKAVLDRIEELAPESNSRVWEATFSGDTTGTV